MKPEPYARVGLAVLLGASALSACSYDFKGWVFKSGAGGAATSASADVGASVSATSGGGAQTTSTVTVGSTVSSGSGGAGGQCSEVPCKPVPPQCGCMPNDECTIQDTDGTRVCAPIGTSDAGELCSGLSGCTLGSACLGGSSAACYAFCASDADCNGALCAAHSTDMNNQFILGVEFCSSICEPLDNQGCGAGLGCQVSKEDSGALRDFTICVPVGAGKQYAQCASDSDCAASFGCWIVNNVAQCLRYCDVNDPQALICPGQQQCLSLTDSKNNKPFIDNGTTYGGCF